MDLKRYSFDESIFEIQPTVVVCPRDEADVQAMVALSQFYSVPITARGGGTSVCGQSIGEGIIVDFSQYFDSILEIGIDHAVVQPGVILDKLNAELAHKGKRFAPDPGSKASCTIGGMVATNASGPHSYRHGSTRENVRGLKVVLADGALLTSHALARRYPTLHPTLARYRDLIEKSKPMTRKNSSGYALHELVKDPPDYTRFLVGTEGTLALTTEIDLKIIPIPRVTSLAILAFRKIEDAIAEVEALRSLAPAAIELMDHHVLRALGRANPHLVSFLGLDEAEASLWVEWEDVAPKELEKMKCHVIEDPTSRSNLWALRSRASKLLHEQPGPRRPLRCIEDTVVPTENLLDYVRSLREILLQHDCDGAIFGHVGDAHLHVNPSIDIQVEKIEERIGSLMEDVYACVLSFGGSISGEHGDGLLRSRFVKKQWAALIPHFQMVKETFDPAGILNPGKKYSEFELAFPPLRNSLQSSREAPLLQEDAQERDRPLR